MTTFKPGDPNIKLMPRLEQPLVEEFMQKLYGPKWCSHCNQVQPVQTYKLEGSDYMKSEGTVVTMGFTGSYVCTACHRTIEVNP